MAAIVAGDGFSMEAFRPEFAARLPDYACPVFVRSSGELANTETFKRKKQPLIEHGFDPVKVGDPLWMRDAASKRYVPLDGDMYARIVARRSQAVRTIGFQPAKPVG